MSKLFTREQARDWLRQNGLKDGKSITNAFIAGIKDVLGGKPLKKRWLLRWAIPGMIGKTKTVYKRLFVRCYRWRRYSVVNNVDFPRTTPSYDPDNLALLHCKRHILWAPKNLRQGEHGWIAWKAPSQNNNHIAEREVFFLRSAELEFLAGITPRMAMRVWGDSWTFPVSVMKCD